jgi:hypothetical protein
MATTHKSSQDEVMGEFISLDRRNLKLLHFGFFHIAFSILLGDTFLIMTFFLYSF